jgi:fumarate reductase subunit C
VVAVAIHAPIGLRNVLREWTRWRGRTLDIALALFALLLLGLGGRAVMAVFVS